MAIEIVDFPIKDGDFQWQNVNVHQRVMFNMGSGFNMWFQQGGSAKADSRDLAPERLKMGW